MDDFVPVLFSKFCACVVLLARDEFSIQFPGVASAGTLCKVMVKSRKEKNMYLLSFFSEFTRWEIFQEMSMCDCYLSSKAVR